MRVLRPSRRVTAGIVVALAIASFVPELALGI
jgi:hypothetical protein